MTSENTAWLKAQNSVLRSSVSPSFSPSYGGSNYFASRLKLAKYAVVLLTIIETLHIAQNDIFDWRYSSASIIDRPITYLHLSLLAPFARNTHFYRLCKCTFCGSTYRLQHSVWRASVFYQVSSYSLFRSSYMQCILLTEPQNRWNISCFLSNSWKMGAKVAGSRHLWFSSWFLYRFVLPVERS